MKYRVVTGMLGASMILTLMTGCGSQKTAQETELQSLVIADMEVIVETEAEEMPETAGETEMKTVSLDLNVSENQEVETDLQGESSPVSDEQVETEQESVSAETESDNTFTGKPGGEEPQSEQYAERQTEKTEAASKNSGTGKNGKQTEGKETEKKQEHKEPETVKQVSGKESEKEADTESETSPEDSRESESESGTTADSGAAGADESESGTGKAAAGEETESESEEESETETETGKAAVGEETEPESEEESETETETGKTVAGEEIGPESEEESESESEEESETEAETEKAAVGEEAESESEEESESESEEESESETEDETGLRLVKGVHINVRETPSTEAGKVASLSMGMEVYVLEAPDDWSHIYFEGASGLAEGYIKTEYLSELEEFNSAKERVNVRKEASMESDRLKVLSEGDTVFLEEQGADGWSRILFASDTDTQEGYIKSEFLEPAAYSEAGEELAAEVERLLTGDGTGAGETTEPEANEAGPAETSETESGTEAETEQETESADDSDGETEAAEEETEPDTKAESNGTAVELPENAPTAQGQLVLLQHLYSDVTSAGIIYSVDNQNAAAQLKEYEEFCGEYGIELTTTAIEEDIDIDLAASEMAGNVDGILCIDDPLVNGLLQTVCAYANDVGIPVIGMKEEQLEQGCLAAYEEGELFWNPESAEILGFSAEAPEL